MSEGSFKYPIDNFHGVPKEITPANPNPEYKQEKYKYEPKNPIQVEGNIIKKGNTYYEIQDGQLRAIDAKEVEGNKRFYVEESNSWFETINGVDVAIPPVRVIDGVEWTVNPETGKDVYSRTIEISEDAIAYQIENKIKSGYANVVQIKDDIIAYKEKKDIKYAENELARKGITTDDAEYDAMFEEEYSRAKEMSDTVWLGVAGKGSGKLLSVLDKLKAFRYVRTTVKGPGKAANIAVRQAYVNEVRGLGNLEQTLRSEGKSLEEIAKTLQQARRDLGVQYKDMTSPEMLKVIYARNIEKYGDKLGPTVDWLRARGKSWEQIIESAKTPGKEFNDLAGIK